MNIQTDSRPLVYRIDARNRITWVNDAWSEFARDNHGESVLPAQVIGHDLLAAIVDPAVRGIYLAIIARVRAGAVVEFTYRCDAPDKRRVFHMKVHRLADGGEEFTSTLIHEEARPSVAVLEPDGVRSKSLIRVCSWCQKVAMPDGQWLPVEPAMAELHLMEAGNLPALTHGICPPCHAGMMAKFEPL
jgi:hypothetical protein